MKYFKKEYLSDATSIVTGAFALENIEEILSIIILVISIANILFNMGCRIYTHIKNKNVEAISDDINDGVDALKEIDSKIKNKRNEEKQK